MNGHFNPFQSGWRQTSNTIRKIILANAIIFFLQILLQTNQDALLVKAFALIPQKVVFKLQIWRLFTYMFLHGGMMHIAMNMFGLWMFGREIEQILGRKRFLNFYILTGVCSGLLTAILSFNSTTPVIGASGAVFAVLLAFALYFPNRTIYFNLLFPIPAKIFVAILAVITITSTFGQSGDGISHSTHLGGLLFGWLFLRKFPGILSFDLAKFRIGKTPENVVKMKSQIGFWNKLLRKFGIKFTKKRPHDLHREVNRILDKMNRLGYHNLTEEEIEILRKSADKFHKNERPN